MERATGFGPATSTLARLHSTTELRPHEYDAICAPSGLANITKWSILVNRKVFPHLTKQRYCGNLILPIKQQDTGG